MALPTLGFLKASLKLWQAREKHHAKLVTRDKKKVALRKRQLAERLKLDANRPTVMYDSVTVSAIPANAQAVAGYTAGRFLTFPTLVKQFPKARKLSIAVASRFDAECLDVEPGDATPDVAAGWVKRQQARGVKRPVVSGCPHPSPPAGPTGKRPFRPASGSPPRSSASARSGWTGRPPATGRRR
jgi:hypothetical protein